MSTQINTRNRLAIQRVSTVLEEEDEDEDEEMGRIETNEQEPNPKYKRKAADTEASSGQRALWAEAKDKIRRRSQDGAEQLLKLFNASSDSLRRRISQDGEPGNEEGGELDRLRDEFGKGGSIQVIDLERASDGGDILARLGLSYEDMAKAVDTM